MHTFNKSVILFILLIVSLLCLPLAAQDDLPLADFDGTPIEVGETIEGELNEDIPLAKYTFEGSEGDAITAYVDDEDYIASMLVIADTDGKILMEGSSDPFLEVTQRLLIFVLPDDGEYSLVVTTSDFYYLQEPGEDSVFSITLDEPEFETLGFGDSVGGELTEENVFDLYVLPVEQGQIPQIILESGDSEIEVGSTGNADFDSRSGNNPIGSTDSHVSPFYVFDDDLLYILVSSFAFEPQDEYTLNIGEYEPVEIASGDTITVTLSIETISNFVAFEAEEDEEVTITGDSPENIAAEMALFDPDGRVIAVETVADGINGLELRESGTYILQVYPGGFLIELSNLGEVEISLEIAD